MMTSVCHLTALNILPPVGICKSPAVFVDAAVQVVLASLEDHCTFLGSPPAPKAIT